MTCIVGAVVRGRTYIGGDSASVSDHIHVARTDRKVLRKDGYVFGFTGSWRLVQIVAHAWTLPLRPAGSSLEDYAVGQAMWSLRAALKTRGFLHVEDGVETIPDRGAFMFGSRGELVLVYADFQVANRGESDAPYSALGSGREVALGALYRRWPPRKGQEKATLRLSLAAAEHHVTTVQRPFSVLSA